MSGNLDGPNLRPSLYFYYMKGDLGGTDYLCFLIKENQVQLRFDRLVFGPRYAHFESVHIPLSRLSCEKF